MGFLGRILDVDLTHQRVAVAEYDEGLARHLLTGRGATSNELLRRVPAGIDPLGPDNPLVMSSGLLTGTEAPASSRLHVGARSPLTGLLGSSNVGAHFGAELRAAGYQTLILHGRADRPVYLSITSRGVELLDARELWGLDAWETQDQLSSLTGNSSARFMVIGPGGEAGVPYACIMTERGHAAGRTGMGAVMGSKGVKAIVVRGESHPRSENPAAHQAVREYAMAIRNSPRYATYSTYSNTRLVGFANEAGLLATRNYQQGQFEEVEGIDGPKVQEYVRKSKGCYRCPVHCKAEIKVDSGPFAGFEGERPDFEPLVALGSKCGVGDVEAVLYLYNLCCRLGIDVISAASSIAFAMDLFDKGIISAADSDGMELRWGDSHAMEVMLRKIARREGFGAVLAEGVARAAAQIGRGAEALAYHVKGLELTAYDPRGAMGTALGYAVSTRGADFTSIYAVPEYRWEPERGEKVFGSPLSVDRLSPEGKGALIRRSMSVSATLDSLGLCKVPVLSVVGEFSMEAEARLTSALTGWQITPSDLLTIGERIINIERLFDLRQGAEVSDDTLPGYFAHSRVAGGPTEGRRVDVEPMVRQFYAAMGWDADGRPTEEKLKELGIAPAY